VVSQIQVKSGTGQSPVVSHMAQGQIASVLNETHLSVG